MVAGIGYCRDSRSLLRHEVVKGNSHPRGTRDERSSYLVELLPHTLIASVSLTVRVIT